MIDEKELMLHIEKQYAEWGEEYDAVQILGDIEDFPKINEWIPVEEKLPNDRQVVLTVKNNHISILEYHADTKHWFETKGNWWWSYNMVDAWMPLPKPYKEVK